MAARACVKACPATISGSVPTVGLRVGDFVGLLTAVGRRCGDPVGGGPGGLVGFFRGARVDAMVVEGMESKEAMMLVATERKMVLCTFMVSWFVRLKY